MPLGCTNKSNAIMLVRGARISLVPPIKTYSIIGQMLGCKMSKRSLWHQPLTDCLQRPLHALAPSSAWSCWCYSFDSMSQACHAATAALWESREEAVTLEYTSPGKIDHMHKAKCIICFPGLTLELPVYLDVVCIQDVLTCIISISFNMLGLRRDIVLWTHWRQ